MFTSFRNLTNTYPVVDMLTKVNNGTDLPELNTLVQRDANGGFSVNTLKANAIESVGSILNIASDNNTNTLNIGSGTAVQLINMGNSGVGPTTINIGGGSDIVNITGTLTTVNTTNTQVQDKSLVLNAGGAAASSGTSGIYFEEATDNTSSFIRVASDRTKIEMKPFSGDLITLNQSLAKTDPVTFSSLVTTAGRKRIVMGEYGDPLSISDHRFDGIGKDVNDMIFQVGAGDMVFNSATSSTTSTELMRIAANGIVTIPTMLLASDRCSAGFFNIINDGRINFANTNVRKRIALSSTGATTSTDHRFSGFGKASNELVYQTSGTTENHVFYAATGSLSSNELMRINGTGAVQISNTLAITGNVSCGSLTVAGTPHIPIPSFEEFDFTSVFTGTYTTNALVFKISKIGRTINLFCQDVSVGIPVNNNSGGFINSTGIPARFLSVNLVTLSIPVAVLNNGVWDLGEVEIEIYSGNIRIRRSVNNGLDFTGPGLCGFRAWSATYQI